MAIYWNRRKYTPEQFEKAWLESDSVFEVARKLGVCGTGGAHATLKRTADALGLDRSHMTGKAWSKGKTLNPRRSIEEILKDDTIFQSHALKIRLIKEGVFENKCSICDIDEWQGVPAPLELDHINGKHTDNRIENLRILCRNCHGIQDNHAGKNKKDGRNPLRNVCPSCLGWRNSSAMLCAECRAREDTKKWIESPSRKCPDCGGEKSYQAVRCRSCSDSQRRKHPSHTVIEWPDFETLQEMVRETSFLAVSKQLGVSDNAIRKRLSKRGVDVAALSKYHKKHNHS